MNIVSLVLFGQDDRYWHTLATGLIGYAELYPAYTIRLHHSSDAALHPGFPLLRELAETTGRLELRHVERGYTETEPTLWRMLPLWDASVDLFLCRDVDSVPSSPELRAVRVFEREDSPPIHGIRSYRYHTTLLMAGLCGFKNRQLEFLRSRIGSFEHYRHIYVRLDGRFGFGCDQRALALTLCRHADRILDTRLETAPPLALPVATVASATYEAAPLDDVHPDILRLCDETTRSAWGRDEGFPGRPQVDTRPCLRRLLQIETPFIAACRAALSRPGVAGQLGLASP